MECKHAQLLIQIVRPGSIDIESVDRVELESHLATCPACEELARTEGKIHDQISKAMLQVDVPDRLRSRLLLRLSIDRKNWYKKHLGRAAIALSGLAALALLGWGVWFWQFGRPAEIDLEGVWARANQITGEAYSSRWVEMFFKRKGYPMVAPETLNYELITSCSLGDFQGKTVPQMTFVKTFKEGVRDHRGPSSDYALIYVLSRNQFDLRTLNQHQPSSQDYPFNVEVVYNEGDSQALLILYTGNDISWLYRKKESAI